MKIINTLCLLLIVCALSACSFLGMQPQSQSVLDTKYSFASTQYIPFKNTKLRVDDQGQGRVLVLVHGLVASFNTWDDWVKTLNKHYRVIRIDLPGFGLSGNPANKGYQPQDHINAVHAVLKAKNIDKATIIGHSFGGFVAWNLAVTHPDLVERIVLMDALSFTQDWALEIKLLGLPVVKQIAQIMTPKPFFNYALNTMYADKSRIPKKDRQRYFDFLMYQGAKKQLVESTAWVSKYHKNMDKKFDKRLLNIKQPLMTMWGVKDKWVPYSVAKQWHKHYPHATHISLKDVGHLPMEEQPSSLKYILKFLNESDALLEK